MSKHMWFMPDQGWVPKSDGQPASESPMLIPAPEEWYEAAKNGDTETFKALLPKVDPNSKDEDGKSALMIASFYGHLGVVEALLAHEGIEINAKSDGGATALKYANNTALRVANINGRSEVARRLREAGGTE